MNNFVGTLALVSLCQSLRLSPTTASEKSTNPFVSDSPSSNSISQEFAALHVPSELPYPNGLLKEWLEMTVQSPAFSRKAFSEKQARQASQTPKGSIAIVTSGMLKRYFLESIAVGLLEPIVSQGYVADYFLALGTGDFASYRPNGNTFERDAALPNHISGVAEMINKTVQSVGANLRHIDLFEKLDLNEPIQKEFLSEGKLNNPTARINALKKMLKYQELKNAMEKQEMKSGAYDWVLMLVDDAMFVEPMNFLKLIQMGDEADTTCGKPNQSASLAFNLHCGPGSTYPSSCGMLTDYGFVLDRQAARTFMSQYSILLHNSHDLHPDQSSSNHHWGHGNFESFLRAIANENGVHVKSMPARLFPFQRAGHVRHDNGTLQICLHKVCDSKSRNSEPLDPYQYLSRCHGSARR